MKIGKEDSDFAGLTPFYSISAYSSQTGQFMLAGYNYDGKNNALMYKGKYYRINDADFAEYLSNICAGNDVSQAVEMDKWDCSVICVEESTPKNYVINYSDVKVSSQTGTLTFQNRNGFDITIHVLREGETEVVSDIIAGGWYSLLKMNDKPCTIGVHADVDVNTEIKLFVYDGNFETVTSVVEQNYFSLPTDQYQDFETAIKSMGNNENTQVFDVYPVDNDIVLAGFTTGSDLSFATLTKSGNEEYKIRAYRELGRASLNSMTIIQEQNIDQSLTVALSNRLDLARVTAQYGGTILEKTVDSCPAMIVFEWKKILPEDATVTVRFYNADNKELERIEDSADE